MEWVPLIVALAVAVPSFGLGVAFGSRRAFSLVRVARRNRETAARMSPFLDGVVPTRSAEDILSGRVRVRLGGLTYDLPVLPRRASREWMASVEQRFSELTEALVETENDVASALGLLKAHTDELYGFLLTYDTSHVLPSWTEADVVATDAE